MAEAGTANSDASIRSRPIFLYYLLYALNTSKRIRTIMEEISTATSALRSRDSLFNFLSLFSLFDIENDDITWVYMCQHVLHTLKPLLSFNNLYVLE
jgi:hypothetical protein